MAVISYRRRYKIKTHIKGLDDILHGGIVYNGFDIGTSNDNKNSDGILLSLNGERGVNKTAFAIHMCHGITRSLYRIQNTEAEKECKSVLFSVNKTKELLQQMHENAAISRLLRRGIQDFVIDKHDGQIESSLLYQVVSTFFSDIAIVHDPAEGDQHTNFADRYKDRNSEICKLLAQGAVSFNVHSRTLNFKHMKINTGLNRIRKFSGFESIKFSEGLINEYLQEIDFNNGIEDNTPKFISRFENILDKISELYERCDGAKRKLPCLVVDGLSQLTDDELKTIPIDYLQRILRKIAYISILVFDERGKNVCRNSDMIIELNRNTDREISSLSYYTLEIKKCMIQKFSPGKHLYKLTDTGISVFPSLEYILNYSALKSDIYSDLDRGMFNTSYGGYLKGFHRHLFNNALVDTEAEEYDVIHNTIESNLHTFDKYVADNNLHRKAFIDTLCRQYTSGLGERTCEKLLNNILFHADMPDNGKVYTDNANLVTLLVSCKNSYKRTLSNAVIFNALHCWNFKDRCENVTKDVLFVSFGNNRQQLLRTVACPCLKENHHGRHCLECYDRIHLYSVPFGDISASEMIYMLDDIIGTYNKMESRHIIGQIIIDDMNGNVVRNAHPFIYGDQLLIPALFKLLREKQIPVTILSDISEQGYKEMCDFADNVIYTRRRKVSSEPYKEVLDIFVAKDYRYCNPRKSYGCSLKISDYSNLINHEGDTFTLRSEAVINDREVSPLEIDIFNKKY